MRTLLGSILLCAGAAPAAAQGGCDWQPASDAPAARLEPASALVDGRLVLFGGFAAQLAPLTRVDAYDPASDSWAQLASLPAPVTHAGIARAGRQIWLAGGFVGQHPGLVVTDVWIYDIDLDAWSAGPPLPAPRGSGGMFRIGRFLHFVGGVAADRDTDEDEHWVLDLDNPFGWSPAEPLPSPRNHFAAISFEERGYVIGGQFAHDTAPVDVALVHVYDPSSGWHALASLPKPRSHFEAAALVHDGRIVIAGGRSNPLGLAALADVTSYDPLANAWSAEAPLPGALIAPALKKIGTELVLAAGGTTATQPVAATWRRPADGGLPAHLRVNSGGGPLALGEAWCADFAALGGQTFANPLALEIAGTGEDELYASERTGSNAAPTHFAYQVPLEVGHYRVRLHFAEIYWGAPGGGPGGAGKRVFDVRVEGQLALDDYDIYAAVGAAAADVRAFDVELTDGLLDLAFDASVDRPKLSAFEAIELSSAGSYCSASVNSSGAPAELWAGGSASLAANDFTLVARACPASSLGLFLQSPLQTQVALDSGTLCVGPALFRLLPLAKTDVFGAAERTLDLSKPHLPAAEIEAGATWNFQFYFRDTPLSTANLTNALSLTFLP